VIAGIIIIGKMFGDSWIVSRKMVVDSWRVSGKIFCGSWTVSGKMVGETEQLVKWRFVIAEQLVERWLVKLNS
jgi:hypothetical protein